MALIRVICRQDGSLVLRLQSESLAIRTGRPLLRRWAGRLSYDACRQRDGLRLTRKPGARTSPKLAENSCWRAGQRVAREARRPIGRSSARSGKALSKAAEAGFAPGSAAGEPLFPDCTLRLLSWQAAVSLFFLGASWKDLERCAAGGDCKCALETRAPGAGCGRCAIGR